MHCRTLLQLALGIAVATSAIAASAASRMTLKNICHVKGQEENTIQGLGIVVGLKGTGDGGTYLPTIRSVARVMTNLKNAPGRNPYAELKDTKNVALVSVTATIPAAGARQGDKIDCIVSSIGSSKSLVGGQLFITPLVGPDPRNPRVYAFAQGSLAIEDSTTPTTARIHDGCRLEEDFFNVFTKDGRLTLVIDKNHADFQVAQDITELVNTQMSRQTSSSAPLARALNQGNVEIVIPQQYREDPVSFVSQVMALPIMEPRTVPRVVVNERTGVIVFDGDVVIGAVAVTHKNIAIETGAATGVAKPFVPIDPLDPNSPRLKSLVEALNAVHVPTDDIIDIIKSLDRNGKLHAQLVIQ